MEISLEQIYNLINEKHNPNLVESDIIGTINYVNNTCPNSNTIYHLYNDGEITYQKGAWAYLQRSEFQKFESINYEFDYNRFPKKSRNNQGYCIVTLENALIIRNLMIEYLDCKKITSF